VKGWMANGAVKTPASPMGPSRPSGPRYVPAIHSIGQQLLSRQPLVYLILLVLLN
jgi:hypothetical protein